MLSAFDCLRMRPFSEQLQAGWTAGAPVDIVGNCTRIRCVQLIARWVRWTQSSPVTPVSIMRDVLYVVSRETAIDKHEPDQRTEPYLSLNKRKWKSPIHFEQIKPRHSKRC